jgi:hypothetical protein
MLSAQGASQSYSSGDSSHPHLGDRGTTDPIAAGARCSTEPTHGASNDALISRPLSLYTHLSRHSPDDARTGVNSSDFLAFLEARRAAGSYPHNGRLFAPILISLSFKVVSDQSLIGSGVASVRRKLRGCRRAHEAGAAPHWRRTFDTTVAST